METEDDRERQRWSDDEFCLLVLEVTVAVIYIWLGVGVYAAAEEWTLIDSLYFVVVTVSTVGYGDMSPSMTGTKLFTVAYTWVAMLLLASSLGAHVALATERLARSLSVKEEKTGVQSSICGKLCGTADKRRLWGTSLLVVLTTLTGMFFYGGYQPEDISWLDAFYLSAMTLTTVGYGDVSPTTEGARMFSVFWVLIGVIVFAGWVSLVASIYIKAKLKRWQKQRLKQPITLTDLEQFGGEDGKLDRCEFALVKLLAQSKVTKKELLTCWKLFDEMDVDNSGFLDSQDILGQPTQPSTGTGVNGNDSGANSLVRPSNFDHDSLSSTSAQFADEQL